MNVLSVTYLTSCFSLSDVHKMCCVVSPNVPVSRKWITFEWLFEHNLFIVFVMFEKPTDTWWIHRAAALWFCVCILVCNSLTKEVWSVPLYDLTRDQVKTHFKKALHLVVPTARWARLVKDGTVQRVLTCMSAGKWALSPSALLFLFAPLSSRVFFKQEKDEQEEEGKEDGKR